ncbi:MULTISPECIES: DUF4832 domain-containing protein [Asticcacaulis]|uniref:DUF4832 domain-containing protein n=1 Tax=Asticcacaulis TaxID=76890 RepID=UPI001AE1F43A|nr:MULTISPECIES: DUF4832 domain-containing protein [Asticcacaulis]MBP2161606.1 hypothetical protein [Asticcacaulis solisilvae]MDR6802651.1 hypothetical protein [Asticcacaulis sp. BE141]
MTKSVSKAKPRFIALSSVLGLSLVACGGGSGTAHSAASEGTPPSSSAAVIAVFKPSDADFANPERGFYRAAQSDFDQLTAASVAEAYAAGFRLMYVRINLERYRDADIPAAYLDRLEAAFATARAGGVKLIVRATYNYPRGETEYRDAQDAPLARVKGHLLQLKPVFSRNADVISVVQAGFIGAWGEWHTSSNNLTTPDNRTRIRDALLDAVPATRFIQFRYPPYLQDWTPGLPALDKAVTGAFRLGFHNDCFLASQTDVGTFDEDAAARAGQQAYLDQLGDLAPFGGETCNPADDPGATPRTACADILAEGARYNLTYLNDGYYRRLFHDNWTKEGCMAEVRRSMGYRLGLVSVSHPTAATRGSDLTLQIVVRNSGWARLYNPRPIQVVLRDPVSGALRRIEARGADARRWLPGAEATETLTITLPADVAVGTKEMWLALPDADSRLGNDGRYAIRPANADDPAIGQGWDATFGAFALGTKIDIR